MKKNGVLETFPITKSARDFLDFLNAGVLCFQHTVVCFQPDGIKNVPEETADHPAHRNHRCQLTTTDPVKEQLPVLLSNAHVGVIPY